MSTRRDTHRKAGSRANTNRNARGFGGCPFCGAPPGHNCVKPGTADQAERAKFPTVAEAIFCRPASRIHAQRPRLGAEPTQTQGGQTE